MKRANPTFQEISDAIQWYHGNAEYSVYLQKQASLQPTLQQYFGRGNPTHDELRTIGVIAKTWGVQGVTKADFDAAARVLADHGTRRKLRKLNADGPTNAEAVANAVRHVYRGIKKEGMAREHVSWVTKLLHRMMPHVVPPFDSYVCAALGITVVGSDEAANRAENRLVAFEQMIAWEYGVLEALQLQTALPSNQLQGITPLQAIDKYLWKWWQDWSQHLAQQARRRT